MTQLETQLSQQQPVTTDAAKEAVKEKGQELRTQATGRLRQEVQSRTTQAADQVQSLSLTLRRTGSELRAQGQTGQGNALDQVAMRAEQLGGYLTQADADSLLNDARQYGTRVKDFITQQPLLVASGGLTLGILGSRLLKGGNDSQSSPRRVQPGIEAPASVVDADRDRELSGRRPVAVRRRRTT